MKLSIATLNVRGLQAPRSWERFLDAVTRWSRRHRVSVIFAQEHNLSPDREPELRRQAGLMGMTAVIGFAQPAPDGVHRGGVLMLSFDKEAVLKGVIERAGDLVRVQVEAGGRTHDLAGVYAPAKPSLRVDMFNTLQPRLGSGTIVGGDWNCVPDVTLDVKSSHQLEYPNIGATKLAATMDTLNLYDIRREQLGSEHEYTRISDNSNMITTRLDRWYVPISEAFDGTLWNVKITDTLVWKDSPSDHLPVILHVEGTRGERGHERKNIRGDLLARPHIQAMVINVCNKAYDLGGTQEERWTRAHNMMRSALLAETAKERKKDKPAILNTRAQLEVIRRMIAHRGLTPDLQRSREEAQRTLLKLERPEVRADEPETAKKMRDQSDNCTRAMFQSYKGVAAQQWINEMKIAQEWRDGQEPVYTHNDGAVRYTQHTKEVAHTIGEYYKMLYSEKEYDKTASDAILKEMGRTKLTQKAVRTLDAPITDKEIVAVMESLPTGKQAGPDRIPNEVYKYCSEYFAPKLGIILRGATMRGRLPEEMRKGDICVLFKKGDRDEVRNYRPITLLQNSYKIFTRVLTQRMNKVVHQFVAETQKGFVPHTFIADCTMMMNLIEAYLNEGDDESKKGLMIFLDMEKAFDRVSYDFIMSGLEALGFGEAFRRTIRMMYNTGRSPKRRIYANGYYSEWFDIKSGVAQGCPLSPLLFLIVAQGLKTSLDLHKVEGINIKGVVTTLSQFADDTSLLLRNTDQLVPAFAAVDQWCAATAMRENVKKREGLAMGMYRGASWMDPQRQERVRRRGTEGHKIAAGIKWAQEGEWVTSLGVPIGNDLDHTKWWDKKIQATRDKANRWAGLHRSGFFGRNLVVQTMYFGRLRYWLWSLPMNKTLRAKVQADADRLWWSRDPILDGSVRRVRRFVEKQTAVGPKSKGGVNAMDWSDHVDAVQASWILKYLHPSQSAWKTLLDAMMWEDEEGRLILGGGRETLMCPLSRADKYRLFKQLPRRATYIKECMKAHWKVGYELDKYDCFDHDGIGAENLWHNHRFSIQCNGRVRWYMVNVLDVTKISDIIDRETGRPFDREGWEVWIRHYHRDHLCVVPKQKEVEARASQIMSIVDQVPEDIIEEVCSAQEHKPKDGELVCLLHKDAQDRAEEPTYAVFERDKELKELNLKGSWYRVVWVDAVGIPHPTEERWGARAAKEAGYCAFEVVRWPAKDADRTQDTRKGPKGTRARTGNKAEGRVVGPVHTTFPRPTGWRVGGVPVNLGKLGVSQLTKIYTHRKFRPPTAEKGWQTRLGDGTKVPWPLPWRVRGFFATPRDCVPHTKLLRRNLFTASRDPESDGKCLCCGKVENQLHLAECAPIRNLFWEPLLQLMRLEGMTVPAGWDEVTAMLVTFRVTDEDVVTREQADLIMIGLRCLYAELVHTRAEKQTVQLHRAKDRAIALLKSRVVAYGESWAFFFNTRVFTTKSPVVPPEVQKGIAWIDLTPDAEYYVSPVLQGHTGVQREKPGMVVGKKKKADTEATPPTVTLDRHTHQTAFRSTGRHSTPRRGDESGARAAPEVTRDMSGDALTYRECCNMTPRPFAECALSAYRNILREENATRASLAALQLPGGEAGDLRFPDWERIFREIAEGGEATVVFYPHELGDREEWLDARVAVLLTTGPDHVVALWRHHDGSSFRLYDNDSAERNHGTYRLIKARDLGGRGRVVAVARVGSPLEATARAHTQRRGARRVVRSAPRTREEGMPTYNNPVARRVGNPSSEGD